MVKNIIFDIGSVLVSFDPVKVLKAMKVPVKAIEEVIKHTVLGPLWKELDRGLIEKTKVFDSMIQDVPVEYQDYARDFLYNHSYETVESYDYSKEWLKSLKQRGYNIYLLTNYPDWLFDEHYKKTFTFTDYVDGEVVSGKVKLIKPDPAIYKAILQKYSLRAEECVFIDDRIENVEAACKLGIKGIHFTNINEVKNKLNDVLS